MELVGVGLLVGQLECIFWCVTLCILVEHYQRFRRTLLPRKLRRHIVRNLGNDLPIYTPSYPEDNDLHKYLLHIFREKSSLLYENQFHFQFESTRLCSGKELNSWLRPTSIRTRQFIKNSFSLVS